MYDYVLKDKLYENTLNTVNKIVKKNEEKLLKVENDVNVLKDGIFYCVDYAERLNQWNQIKRLTWFKNLGHLFHGFAPQKYFSMTKNEESFTGIQPHLFTIKKDVNPSEALEAMQKELALLGCGSVILIGENSGLKSVLGDEKYNYLFSFDSETPLTIGEGGQISSIDSLKIWKKIEDINKIELLPGQRVGVDGPCIEKMQPITYEKSMTNLYNVKNIFGNSQSFNVICSEAGEDPKYIGLGLDSKGITYKKITEKLVDEYNKMPVNGLDVLSEKHYKKIKVSEEELNTIESLKYHQITYKGFFEDYNGGEAHLMDFNFERIKTLKKEDKETAREFLTEWHKKLKIKLGSN